jgi:hypothetical protein
MTQHNEIAVILRLRRQLRAVDRVVVRWEEAARADVPPDGFRCVWDLRTAARHMRPRAYRLRPRAADESACTPGSVTGAPRGTAPADGHPSTPAVADRL